MTQWSCPCCGSDLPDGRVWDGECPACEASVKEREKAARRQRRREERAEAGSEAAA